MKKLNKVRYNDVTTVVAWKDGNGKWQEGRVGHTTYTGFKMIMVDTIVIGEPVVEGGIPSCRGIYTTAKHVHGRWRVYDEIVGDYTRPLHKRAYRSVTDAQFSAGIHNVYERDTAARALCHEIRKELPPGLKGVVLLNADNAEWVAGRDPADAWMKARGKWGKDIAHPPIWKFPVGGYEEIYKLPVEELR